MNQKLSYNPQTQRGYIYKKVLGRTQIYPWEREIEIEIMGYIGTGKIINRGSGGERSVD